MELKIKKEVRELFEEMLNSQTTKVRSDEISRILRNKWKFTAWNLLALCHNTIEVNERNYDLVVEKEKANVPT